MKEKTCPICGVKFTPLRPIQKVCSAPCAIKHATDKRDKKRAQEERIQQKVDRKIIKFKLEELKPLSYYAEKAQRAVNAYIRARDEGQPCISCGRYHTGKWNAGHYVSRGASPALRYHHDNIHLQCEPCNTSKSGNLIAYRKNLLIKIGQERLDFIEVPHELPRWRKEDYQRIEQEHKQLLKELKNGR